MLKKRLMTPGPTPIPPEVAGALAAPHPHHRTAEFRELTGQVREGLREVFRTGGEVILMTASGTGAMETALTNLTRPGDVVVIVDSGKFGHRWLDLATAFGRKPVVLTPEAGHPVEPAEITRALQENPAATALFFAACESSTGVRVDCRSLAAAARKAAGQRVLVVVDAITEVGAAPVETDEWGLDAVVGGSQKAFMIPPGLAFLALSARAEARLASTGGAGLYFNLGRELAAQRQNATAWTPSTALVSALHAALTSMLAQGMETIWADTERRAKMARAGVTAMGLELFAAAPAVSLTAVKSPEGIDSGKIVSRLEADFGVRIAGGQGDLKGKIFRVAHLGYIDEIETLGTLGALGITLNRLGVRADTASGLAAAAQVMAGSP